MTITDGSAAPKHVDFAGVADHAGGYRFEAFGNSPLVPLGNYGSGLVITLQSERTNWGQPIPEVGVALSDDFKDQAGELIGNALLAPVKSAILPYFAETDREIPPADEKELQIAGLVAEAVFKRLATPQKTAEVGVLAAENSALLLYPHAFRSEVATTIYDINYEMKRGLTILESMNLMSTQRAGVANFVRNGLRSTKRSQRTGKDSDLQRSDAFVGRLMPVIARAVIPREAVVA